MLLHLALALTQTGVSGCPGQELYVLSWDGLVHRVDDYDTNPTPVLVGSTGLHLPGDLAVHPATGEFYVLTVGPSFGYYVLDGATFAPTPVLASALSTPNALDFTADGVMWSRGVGFDLAWVDLAGPTENFIPSIMPSGATGDVAVDLDGTIVGANFQGRLDRFDPVTGNVSVLPQHSLGNSNVSSVEIDCDGAIYLIKKTGEIYTYEPATGNTTFVGSTGFFVNGARSRSRQTDVFNRSVPPTADRRDE